MIIVPVDEERFRHMQATGSTGRFARADLAVTFSEGLRSRFDYMQTVLQKAKQYNNDLLDLRSKGIKVPQKYFIPARAIRRAETAIRMVDKLIKRGL